jgi:hypothetical protein
VDHCGGHRTACGFPRRKPHIASLQCRVAGNPGSDRPFRVFSPGKTTPRDLCRHVMFIDEPQYLQADQFGALISALHRCATIRQLITSAFANADLGRNHARLGQMRSWDGRQTIGGVSNSKRLLAQCSREPNQAFVNRSFIIASEPDKQSLRVWASKSVSIDGKNLDPLGCGQLLCSPRGHAIP